MPGAPKFRSSFDQLLTSYANPAALLIPIPVFLLAAVLVFILPDDPRPYLILISAFVLVIGFFFNSAVKFHSDIRDRTVSFLMHNRGDEAFRNASRRVGMLYRQVNSLNDDNAADIYNSTKQEDKELVQAINIVGNFFEEMAIAVKYREVNETLLKEFYIGILVRYFETTMPLINVTRNTPTEKARAEIFINAEALYQRWGPEYYQYIKSLDGNSNQT